MPRLKSLKVLRREIRILEARAEKLENAEKPGVRQLRAILIKYKLGPSDVKLALNGKLARGGPRGGVRVKPKYRNPDKRSETWTGRGRMPLWMVALVKKGKKAEDFLINQD